MQSVSNLINRLTRSHPSELDETIWFQEEARAERIVNLTRIACLIVWVIVTASISSMLLPIANLANIGIGSVWLFWACLYHAYLLKNPYRLKLKYISTAMDALMNTAILFTYHFGMGYSTSLKSPPFMSYLLFIMFSAFRFNATLSIYSGVLAIISYASLILYFTATHNIVFGTSFESYTTPKVGATVLFFQMAYILGASILGTILAYNARRLVNRQLAHQEAAIQERFERERLYLQSIRDGLTGLFNRRYLDETLPREINRAERGKQPLGVLMFDIDHFKKYNDTYGHDAGDLVLKSLAYAVLSNIRESDIACRYGGEEFVIILPDSPLEAIKRRAESLLKKIAEMDLQHDGKELGKITISIGVAAYPQHGGTHDALIKSADEAAYQAKENGRNRMVVCGK
jgi:diguanylate cyclase (GGDEF)-like protein